MHKEKMIKVFICDDEQSFVVYFRELLEKIFSDFAPKAEITSFDSPEKCLEEVRKSYEPPDVVFLEIDMGEMNGFDLAREIKKESCEVLIVFVTDRHELVFDCFDCHPFSFVRKSGGEQVRRELERTCRDICCFFNQKKLVKIQNVYSGTEYLSANDILFVETDNHYLVWTYRGDGHPIKERGSMENAIEKLRNFRFIRPHCSYLVNASHIKSFSTKFKTIVLDSGDKIPVSRSMKGRAFNDYANYLKSL